MAGIGISKFVAVIFDSEEGSEGTFTCMDSFMNYHSVLTWEEGVCHPMSLEIGPQRGMLPKLMCSDSSLIVPV